VRPRSATAAAVVLFAVGILRGLLYLYAATVLIGRSDRLAEVEGIGEFLVLAVTIIVVSLVAAALQITAGAGVLRLRRRAFTLGLPASVAGLVISLLSLIGAASTPGSDALGLAAAVVFLVGDLAILMLLWATNRYLTV
jgi:hypothetical protein